ncbi:MAG: HAMP domain-containing histidine kinase [Melioribacteraceae bacterium]|nr:HAMP domain-containing histidine kinase [Melioribacteraceae bacterium]
MLNRIYINDVDEKNLFEEVANDIAYALHKFDLQNDKQIAEIRLKKMVQELIKAKDDAVKANKLKSEFLAQMSHEIRSPLNIILNYTNFIKIELDEGNFDTSSDLKGSFESIEIAGNRIIRTINMILNISELQTGSYEPVYKNINLKQDILDPVFRQYKVNAISKNIDFSIHYDILPTVYGDEYSIGQIFSNLIDNAIKYTNKGFVKIRVFSSPDKSVAIRVEDSGIGISQEYLEKIFEPFSQEEQGYSRSYDGNGLGLALVKRYCTINNAEIDIRSEKAKGSSFQITFNGLE